MSRTLIAALLLISYPSYAVPRTYEREESQIPKKPSAPPALIQRVPVEIGHCERYFLYEGRRMECDSSVGTDAEHLRRVMSDVPEALRELDIYRQNRQNIKTVAYVGSVGLLIMVAGFLISRPPVDSSGAIRPGGYVLLGGFGLAANSLIYGLSMVKTNEVHVGNAVQHYNGAHPDRPIELQFSTKVNF